MPTKGGLRHGDGLTDACGKRRLTHVFQSNRKATVVQDAEKVNDGSERKVSEHHAAYGAVHMLTRVHQTCRAMEEGGLVPVAKWVCAALRQAGGGSVTVWAMFCSDL